MESYGNLSVALFLASFPHRVFGDGAGKAYNENLISGGARPRPVKVKSAALSGLQPPTSPSYPNMLTLLCPLPHASRRWRHFKSGNAVDSKVLYGSPSYRIAAPRDLPGSQVCLLVPFVAHTRSSRERPAAKLQMSRGIHLALLFSPSLHSSSLPLPVSRH